MKNLKIEGLLLATMFTGLFTACDSLDKVKPRCPDAGSTQHASLNTGQQVSGAKSKVATAFVHGIVVELDGEDYYFTGPPDGPNGEKDIPGHYWNLAGKDKINGKHFNEGPFGAPNWWSSDAEDGAFIYFVHGIIDTWSNEKASAYAKKGYVHYHEFESVATGQLHPSKIIWLKHNAVTSFTLDGGPGAPNPPYEHYVTPGIDPLFPPNGFVPYTP